MRAGEADGINKIFGALGSEKIISRAADLVAGEGGEDNVFFKIIQSHIGVIVAKGQMALGIKHEAYGLMANHQAPIIKLQIKIPRAYARGICVPLCTPSAFIYIVSSLDLTVGVFTFLE